LFPIKVLLAALVMSLVLAPGTAGACAACFGRSDSSLAKGMNMGILSLLAVVVVIWAGFASFFIYLARRSAATGSLKNQAASLSENTTVAR
jgi:uncharacterized BrkB/YihY/UPF0761 family membrane protein